MITDKLGNDFYFNKALAAEYEREFSPALYFLGQDLTRTRTRGGSTIEERIGVTFKDIRPENVIQAAARTGWNWNPTDEAGVKERLNQTLQELGVNPGNITLDSYLEAGETVLKNLGMPYHRFTTEKVKAYMEISEDQARFFTVDPYHLAIGNTAERAMQEMLYRNGKKFVARSFLIRNTDAMQEEKDITVYTPDASPLGVRCMESYSGSMLYPVRRLKFQRDKIADVVVFFNHIGHHIYYVTGIAEKNFLAKAMYTASGRMEEFRLPEQKEDMVLRSYAFENGLSVDKPEDLTKIVEMFKRRIGFEELMGRLADK